MIIYTDASFHWKKELKSKIKKGKICILLGKKRKILKDIEIPEIWGLKQYTNLLELWAVREALFATRAKEVMLWTDSQVACHWTRRRYNNLAQFSDFHYRLKEEIDEKVVGLKSFEIDWIPRTKNKAGIILEALDKSLETQ